MFLQPFTFFLKVAKIGLSVFSTPSATKRSEHPASATRNETARAAAPVDAAPDAQPARPVVAPAAAEILATALVKAHDATMDALDPKVVDPDVCELRDKRAAEHAEALQRAYESTAAELPDQLRTEYGAVVDRIQQAQLQIMAFAINRKNRGEPDSAQTEAERRDREELRHDVAPAYTALLQALRN
ncbi:MAG: hypothetical protein NVSMB19_22470 [Vulcanimicrobiaceae bacterium]